MASRVTEITEDRCLTELYASYTALFLPPSTDPPRKPRSRPASSHRRLTGRGTEACTQPAASAHEGSERDVGVRAAKLRGLGDGPGEFLTGLAGLDDRVDDAEV